MTIHPLAGKPAPPEMLIDVGRLERDYYERRPDFSDPHQRVLFGTSGHRGTSVKGTFTDAHMAEITARTGKDPGQHYQERTDAFGASYYTRIDAPATPDEKAVLKNPSPESVRATELAGEPITAKLTQAPGNGARLGGLKVTTASGWFAARPSGTENVYKIYAESFQDQTHLDAIVREAHSIVGSALKSRGSGARPAERQP